MTDTTPAPVTRALTGYNLFIQEIVSPKWQSYSSEEQAEWKGRATAGGVKGGYQLFIREWVSPTWAGMSMEEKAALSEKAATLPRVAVKSKKTVATTSPAPEKKEKQERAPTGWVMFQKAEVVSKEDIEQWLQEAEEGEEKERTKRGAGMRIKGQRWRALTEEDKGLWRKQAAKEVVVE